MTDSTVINVLGRVKGSNLRFSCLYNICQGTACQGAREREDVEGISIRTSPASAFFRVNTLTWLMLGVWDSFPDSIFTVMSFEQRPNARSWWCSIDWYTVHCKDNIRDCVGTVLDIPVVLMLGISCCLPIDGCLCVSKCHFQMSNICPHFEVGWNNIIDYVRSIIGRIVLMPKHTSLSKLRN